MQEIRLLWTNGLATGPIKYSADGRPCFGGLWTPATDEARKDLQVVMEEGNAVFGKGTHWIEEREA